MTTDGVVVDAPLRQRFACSIAVGGVYGGEREMERFGDLCSEVPPIVFPQKSESGGDVATESVSGQRDNVSGVTPARRWI